MAELASFWDIPLVSWVATDPDFIDKVTYSTMSRTLGPFNKMGVFLVEILKKYNWSRVVVISSNYLLWFDASKAIRKVFRESNITVAYQSEYDRFPTLDYIQRTLQKVKDEGRSK